MSPPDAPRIRALSDFLDLLDAVATAGHRVVVIGGIAVGFYARRLGETAFSADLDVVTTRDTLEAIVDDAERFGMTVLKRPRPRSLVVAVLDWQGKEVNILTGSNGLPPAEVLLRTAARVDAAPPHEPVALAHPLDLLANKLAVNRPKDAPHISILQRFCEEQCVNTMAKAAVPRERIAFAQDYLAVTGQRVLGAGLLQRLLGVASTRVDFRFLAQHAPSAEDRASVVARADPAWRDELAAMPPGWKKPRKRPPAKR